MADEPPTNAHPQAVFDQENPELEVNHTLQRSRRERATSDKKEKKAHVFALR